MYQSYPVSNARWLPSSPFRCSGKQPASTAPLRRCGAGGLTRKARRRAMRWACACVRCALRPARSIRSNAGSRLRLGGRGRVGPAARVLAVACLRGRGLRQFRGYAADRDVGGADRALWALPLFHETLAGRMADAMPEVPYWPRALSSARSRSSRHQARLGITSVGAYGGPGRADRRAERHTVPHPLTPNR